MVAVEWIVTMREGMKLEQEYPIDILRVTYEDLCASSKTVMQSIVSFCQLSSDDVFFDYAEATLHTNLAKKPFALAKEIEMPFSKTMKQLGYLC